MFVKRDDGLGPVFLPFHIGALLLAALLTWLVHPGGLAVIPIFLGWYIAAFVGLLLLFYLAIFLYSLTIDMSAPPTENHPLVRKIVVTVIATGFDEKKKPETRGVYSAARGEKAAEAPAKKAVTTDNDDFADIFAIFNK